VVALARTDRDGAAVALEERLDHLRERVPFLPEARAAASGLPTFEGLRAVSTPQRLQIDELLRKALEADRFDDELAGQFAAIGPVALATVAARLAQIHYTSASEVDQAQRLHTILQSATGCTEMPFVDAGTLAEIAQGNRHLGELWSWFLNEVGHTDRTWQTYQSLRRNR